MIRIHARSGGNPFFAEEIVPSLVECGALVGAERELREALRIYTAMEATGWMERIAEELAS